MWNLQLSTLLVGHSIVCYHDIVPRPGERPAGLGKQQVIGPVWVHAGFGDVSLVIGALANDPGSSHGIEQSEACQRDSGVARLRQQGPGCVCALVKHVGCGRILAGQRQDGVTAHDASRRIVAASRVMQQVDCHALSEAVAGRERAWAVLQILLRELNFSPNVVQVSDNGVIDIKESFS
jgi:hypothetical protein